MTRASPTKPSVKKDFRLWPFHEMLMNHIKNMGLIPSRFHQIRHILQHCKGFGQLKKETIATNYQVLEIFTQPTYNIKKIKFRGLYTWLFNSSDESPQDLLAEESDNNHRSGPLAWKLLTTNILCGFKQGICSAKNMIHTISLEKFNNIIKSLVRALKENCKLLASCRESKSSILANLLRFPKKPPSSLFDSYIGRFQEKYDDGTNIDLDDFMHTIIMKYATLVEDRQWDTKS